MEAAYVAEGTAIDKGENAQLSSFVGAIAIADLVKTTLGPKGLDKILQRMNPDDQSISVTNDGATILKNVYVDNAAAKVLINMSMVQDEEIGDGTTSVAVLCGELLRQAEQLLLQQRIHPQTVCEGWRLALAASRTALLEASMDIVQVGTESTPDNNDVNNDKYRNDLLEIAKTTLSSKFLTHEKEHFAQLAVDAVLRLKDSNNIDYIQIIKKQGSTLRDSYLEEGFLLPNKGAGIGQPRTLHNATVLVANTSMDTDKIKIYGSRVQVDSINKVAAIEQAEKNKMKIKVNKILDHYDTTAITTESTSEGTIEKKKINCFINRQLIYNYPESLFTAANIMSIEHADFSGVEHLAAVLGCEVVSTFDHPELVTVGSCKIIEEIMIGEDKVLRFGGCKTGAACSIVLRGASSHVLDESERSLHDALAVLISTVKKDPKSIYGGGNTEIRMAAAVDIAAAKTPGKKSLAMTSYATALRQLPTIIADNGGYDSAELVTQLRASIESGKVHSGLDMYNGTIGDMKALGVRESYKSKLQVILSATEAAEMILRVDDIIKAAPRRRDESGY